MLLGKALFQNILLGVKFGGPFLNLLVNRKNTFDDLATIDSNLYKSLVYILQMKEDVSDLYLSFQYKDDARKVSINLKPNGHNIDVTK
jgi:ubiquitin-protein ligase E3 C